MGFPSRLIALWIAVSSIAVAAPPIPHEHVVQPGQTLAKIAKRYNLDLDELCEANDLKKSSRLQPGLRLVLPSEDGRGDSPAQKSSAASSRERSPTGAAAARRIETDRRGVGRSASYAQYLSRATRRGWVHIMFYHGDWQGQLVGKSGKLQPKAIAAVSRLMAWPRTDFLMDRRLLALLTQVSDAFGGRTLRVVSGYRTTSHFSDSKHPLGRACDFQVLGVPNAAVRDFVRTFDNVGVGYYPNSTFVHLDVRDHDAYWVDYAGPGEAPRSTPHRVAKSTTDDSPSDSARAPAVPRREDEPTPNPEAAADLQLPQEQGGNPPADPPAATSPASSDRKGGSRSGRAPATDNAAEPESSGNSNRQNDSSRTQL